MKSKCNFLYKTHFLIALSCVGSVVFAEDSTQSSESTFKNNAVLYGFVRFDTVYDIKGQSNDDWASFLMTQPLSNGSNDHQIYMTARTSRLGVMGTLNDTVKYNLEGDFEGPAGDYNTGVRPSTLGTNSVGFRLRQAYLETHGWLFGQTWTNAADLASMPETVEFNPNLTASAIRQAQIRYTSPNWSGSTLSFSLENPSSYAYSQQNNFSYDVNRVPDFITRYNYGDKWGHIAGIGVVQQYAVNDGVSSRSAIGNLVGLAGNVNIESDNLVFGVFRGNGAGRYQWGSLLQGAVDTGTSISEFKTVSEHIGYTHKWNEIIRSNIVYSGMKFDNNPNGALIAANLPYITNNHSLYEFEINTFYKIDKGVEAGIEYEQGKRKDANGLVLGDESRINFMAMANF